MVDAWKPSFGAELEQIAGAQHVMDTDALTQRPRRASARALHRRRAGVLRRPHLRQGRRRAAHDRELARARHVPARRAALPSRPRVEERPRQRSRSTRWTTCPRRRWAIWRSGFLDHTGVPSVMLSWKCGRQEGSQLELRESRVAAARRRRATLPAAGRCPCASPARARRPRAASPWAPRPSSATWAPAARRGSTPTPRRRATTASSSIARSCSRWRAASAPSTPTDRFGLLSNAWAEVRQGALEPATLLDVLPMFDGETNRLVVEEIASILGSMDHALVGDDDRAAFHRYVTARFAGRKAHARVGAARQGRGRRPGPRAAVGAPRDGRARLRSGHARRGREVTQKWLPDPTSVQADAAAIAVPLASLRAGAARLDELRAAAKAAPCARGARARASARWRRSTIPRCCGRRSICP